MQTYNTIFYDTKSRRYFPGNERDVINTIQSLIFNGKKYGSPLNKVYDALGLSGNVKYEKYRVGDFEIFSVGKPANGIPVMCIRLMLFKEDAKNETHHNND